MTAISSSRLSCQTCCFVGFGVGVWGGGAGGGGVEPGARAVGGGALRRARALALGGSVSSFGTLGSAGFGARRVRSHQLVRDRGEGTRKGGWRQGRARGVGHQRERERERSPLFFFARRPCLSLLSLTSRTRKATPSLVMPVRPSGMARRSRLLLLRELSSCCSCSRSRACPRRAGSVVVVAVDSGTQGPLPSLPLLLS
jgi:hypothetical protein